MEITGNLLIAAGLLVCIVCAFCILQAKNFKQRLLLSSAIYGCGFLTFSLGVVLRSGFTFISLKTVLLVCIALLVNPITSTKVAYSAFDGQNDSDGIDDDDSL